MTRTLPTLLVLVVALLTTSLCVADDLVRVFFDRDPDVLKMVLSTGFRTVLHRRGKFIDVVVPQGRLNDLGTRYRTRILQRAMDRYVINLARRPGWGGYHTFDELRQKLEDWEQRYPLHVSVETIGYGWDTKRGLAHRPVYLTTVGTPAPGKPAILLLGGIHAREIATVDVILQIIENILNDDKERKKLDDVVIYAVPCLNPDGREIVFSGRIWWRKNCRPGHDGRVVGVDLNRNFGHHFGNNPPRGGSSGAPSSETYRGPCAFSEPETRALQLLLQRKDDIVSSLAFHSYGGFLVVPFGYNGNWPPHESLYRSVAANITRDTDWNVGTVRELLGYYSNGRHDDWLYGGIKNKERVLSFQVEMGDTFFTETRKLPSLAKEVGSVVSHLMSRVSLKPAITLETMPPTEDAVRHLALRVQNQRLAPLHGLSITLISPTGRRYHVASELALAGQLRGRGPASIRRLLTLPTEEATGRFAVTVAWQGGSVIRVIDMENSSIRSVLED